MIVVLRALAQRTPSEFAREIALRSDSAGFSPVGNSLWCRISGFFKAPFALLSNWYNILDLVTVSQLILRAVFDSVICQLSWQV